MVTSTPLGPVRPDTAAALLARVARAQSEGRVPSLAVGLVRRGSLAWSAGRGMVGGAEPTPDTQYRIGSITKTFTAVLVLRLRDEGRLSLDDPLDRHVPGTGFGDRTLRDLLAHRAGLAAEPPGSWWERSPGRAWDELGLDATAATVLEAPGRFHYSNSGYAALGRVVASLRGSSWYDALRREVLDPLGLVRTTYDPAAPYAPGLAVHPYADVTMPEAVQDLGDMAAAGQLWSTVADLGRLAAFLAGDTGDVLSAAALAEMRETQVVADGPGWEAGYGLGLQVFKVGGRTLVGHGGSVPGYLAMLFVDPERASATVELANATSSAAVFSGTELLGLLEQHEPTVVPPWQPATGAPSDVLDLVGPWHWGPTPFVLRWRGTGELSLEPLAGRGRASRFRPGADGTWVGRDGYWTGETLRVVRRADGSVSHLDLATFVLTRTPYDPEAPIPGGVDAEPWAG
jgi:CubicO group peptidase (beta-lactamase class C family)